MKRAFRTSTAVAPDAPAFDMSSLIDVAFLLLIYFLATSTLEPKEADLGLTLGGTPPVPGNYEFDPLVVAVTPDGSVEVAGEILDDAQADRRDLPGLRQRLVLFKQTAELMGEAPLVVIKAADEARGQRFVDVINCVAGERIERVSLAAF